MDTADPAFGYVSTRPGQSPDHMTMAAGLFSRLLLGWKPVNPLCRSASDFLLAKLPAWPTSQLDVDFVYWFFGSHALFQVGGDSWKQWNGALKETLLPHQRRGGDEEGSWNPAGTWSAEGGRVASTALGALCLEVYYRYMPLFR